MAHSFFDILVVEDDDLDFVLIQDSLKTAFTSNVNVERAVNLAEAKGFIGNKRYDVVFVDNFLSDGSGMSLIDIEASALQPTPFIMLTGSVENGLDIVALDRGADDFVEKSQLSPDLISRVVSYAIERKRILRSINAARETTVALRDIQKQEIQGFIDNALRLVKCVSCSLNTIQSTSKNDVVNMNCQNAVQSVNLLTDLLKQQTMTHNRQFAYSEIFDHISATMGETDDGGDDEEMEKPRLVS